MSRGLRRLLVINWQDRENPHAGGAEIHLHEIFSRIAASGVEVDLLVSGWPGAAERTELDGMRVRRIGARHTFPVHVRRAYRQLAAARTYDLVVEDINKLPLFTPRWTGRPVVALVPHLFGGTAFREAAWPVAAAVWAAERLIPSVYGSVPFQAISESTAEDLADRGVNRAMIDVIPPGIDHGVYRPGEDDFADPTIVYVGRLKRYKGVDVVIEAVARMDAGIRPEFHIAGRGDDRPRLEALVGRLGLDDRVHFRGFVDEEEKVELLRRAWVNVYPSPKEGWGITNVEAAACGTPSLASDSPGLRESVAHEGSGLLVPHAEIDAWAGALTRLLTDTGLRARLSEGALGHASRFSWDAAARATLDALSRAVSDSPLPEGQ